MLFEASSGKNRSSVADQADRIEQEWIKRIEYKKSRSNEDKGASMVKVDLSV